MKNKLTQEQEKRFDKKFPQETEVSLAGLGVSDYIIESRSKIKQYLADELARERKKIFEMM